jgi:carbamoyltransferase
VTEEIMLRMVRHVRRQTGQTNLCLAGGVALNCVANGRILREGPFDNIWIQPASGDAGAALGAALYGWHHHLKQPRTVTGGVRITVILRSVKRLMLKGLSIASVPSRNWSVM